MKITSERLNLRFFRHEDFPLFYSVFSNEKVMRYAWIDKSNSEEDAYTFFEGFINTGEDVNKNGSYAFAVISKESNEFVGLADIQILSRNNSGGCGEIGYFLLPEYWCRGFATELANSMIEFGFVRLGLHKISARCNSNNQKSEVVMRKAGMTLEGELRKVRFKRGNWDNEKNYGILFEEWKGTNR
ncbi:GNAT family N-acetyltransferase [Ruminiclostridium cellulolyticum]|uniref:GCN5-related N-acetyltransferase n=1 Tax=Ruminiclostridium cellulolyticum (strain ATCC 35319 / DSM 5812 / JCM 6584 / H10) TaxID=394503 RepID=B8I8X0_RUMCH|nr:GNAT family protein [Ruminiclostridium cellulolyticum]ACL77302.1 GCN5-related N-acetyltransferase [Ruminiclostridium cellulolyticum H10]